MSKVVIVLGAGAGGGGAGSTLPRALRERLEDMRLSVEGAARLAVHKGLRSRGHCDPYVTVRVVPASRESPKAKTKVKRRTLFPL